MRHSVRQAICGTAVIAGMTMATAFNAGAVRAREPIEPTQQALADYISADLTEAADGRQPRAIVDSGSSGWATSVASDAYGEGPEMSAYLAAFAYGLTHPDAAPPNANRWDCAPTVEHPRPVVLLHGTWLNAYDTFSYLSPRLARSGFCVFAFNFGRSGMAQGGGLGPVLPGRYGVGRMEDSARQLREFIDRVLAVTGADAVDIIAHSQGGTVADQYLKFEGGEGRVRKLITYGATHHGTSLSGIATLGRIITNFGVDILGFYEPLVGFASIQQAVGSPFYPRLNERGDTVPGVDYTAVGSRYDQVANPYDWTFLVAGPGANVDNITLQEGCEQDLSDHLTMMYSPRAVSIALRALDPTAHPVLECTFNPWLIGGNGSF
ncbi:alpha/beta fold hydrolase [Nocardia sp. NBC_01730]|uniref:esterase/lipase family protein n=1 Tax=Nocardia sp. NBC_01730 TaxID=2975998 RepID=UPI002E15D53B|nr:alpha/beta fold hydrolase [Nocardia sp. NBC_01730]